MAVWWLETSPVSRDGLTLPEIPNIEYSMV